MIYRILAFILVYVSLPLAWVSLGLFLALAPARCGRFIDENVISLPRGGLHCCRAGRDFASARSLNRKAATRRG